MSGVNCHMLMTAGAPTPELKPDASVAWQRSRFWGAPKHSLLLSCVSHTSGKATFQCSLTSAGAAFLWDHRCELDVHAIIPWALHSNCGSLSLHVSCTCGACPRRKQSVVGRCRVQNRVLVPGTAFFEIGSAAVATLAGSEQPVQLCQLAIHSPKLLALAAENSCPSLLCSVDCRSGSLSIASPRVSALHHVTAQAAVAGATQLQTQNIRLIACLSPVSALAASMEPAQAGTMAQLAALHDGMAVGATAFGAHPASADAALHLGAADTALGEAPRVPVGLDSMLCGSQQSCLRSSSGWAIAGEYHPLCQNTLAIWEDNCLKDVNTGTAILELSAGTVACAG